MPGDPRLADLDQALRLYLIADPEHAPGPLEAIVTEALSGGVTAVQLRAKRLSDREALALAERLMTRCRAAGALFFVNDRLDLALASGTDGVHLGVDDLPLEAARRLAPRLLIGYSPETDEQTRAALARGADYLGVGPVFGTATKPDAGTAIGIATIKRRATLADIPLIGIGGITADNAGSVIEAGAVGVAVVSAILRATDPAAAARRLAEAVGDSRAPRP